MGAALQEAQQRAQAQQGDGDQNTQGSSMFKIFIQIFLAYQVISWLTGGSSGQNTGGSNRGGVNIWQIGQPFELFLYVNEYPSFEMDPNIEDSLIWHELDIDYTWENSNSRSTNLTISPTHSLLNNETIYAHVVFKAPEGHGENMAKRLEKPKRQHIKNKKSNVPNTDIKKEKSSSNSRFETIILSEQINTYKPLPTLTGSKNLLKAYEDIDTKSNINTEHVIGSLWRPELNIRMVLAEEYMTAPQAPEAKFLKIDRKTGSIYPIVYIDYFWCLSERFTILNNSISLEDKLNLEVSFEFISLWWFRMKSQFEQQQEKQSEYLSQTESEGEELKRMFTETPLWLLVLGLVVSVLHTLFDFLAFKNDIQFWRSERSLEGLSVRTIFINAACQVIIFFYLLDNETSWLILISSGIGCLIEFWKVGRATKVSVHKWKGIIPYLRFKDKESYSKTAHHDAQAMKYLSYLLFPCVIGYFIYSLLYEEHRGWYSFILSSLTGCVYTFGFVMMCPQLYLNYKLQSVAHLPWRMLTYKALNTVIDDIFAFIIKMPTLHRLSCFRDDLIFVIYIYQRYKYRTDYTRVNEFGTVSEAQFLNCDQKRELLTHSREILVEKLPRVTSDIVIGYMYGKEIFDTDTDIKISESELKSKKEKLKYL